jgi:hypothetical protein
MRLSPEGYGSQSAAAHAGFAFVPSSWELLQGHFRFATIKYGSSVDFTFCFFVIGVLLLPLCFSCAFNNAVRPFVLRHGKAVLELCLLAVNFEPQYVPDASRIFFFRQTSIMPPFLKLYPNPPSRFPFPQSVATNVVPRRSIGHLDGGTLMLARVMKRSSDSHRNHIATKT